MDQYIGCNAICQPFYGVSVVLMDAAGIYTVTSLDIGRRARSPHPIRTTPSTSPYDRSCGAGRDRMGGNNQCARRVYGFRKRRIMAGGSPRHRYGGERSK